MTRRIALLQIDTVWESKERNYEKAATLIRHAASMDCVIAALPEMFSTGFTMNLEVADAEEFGETHRFLSGLSAQFSMSIIAGHSVRPSRKIRGRNLARAYDGSGHVIATYSKARPFPLAREALYYEAGEGPSVFEIESLSASMLVCYDLRFPELFRPLAPQVSAFFVLANWPSSREDHWTSLLKARAIENQCYVIGVNRTGTDGHGIAYPGRSHVYDPLGEVVLSGGNEEGVLVAEIEPAEVVRVRGEFPFLPQSRQFLGDPLNR